MTYSQPFYPLLTAITLVALVWHWRRAARPKPWFLTAAIIAQLLFTLPVVSGLGSWTLERGYAIAATPPREAEAIVILAGAVHGPRPDRPNTLLGSDTFVRCQHAAWLFQNWHELPVVVCGGTIKDTAGTAGTALAETMRDALEKEGIPSDRIWCERRSTSTYENALYAAQLLREQGISRVALVTEAFHMPRAERCFRKQGIDVVPAPCAFRTGYGLEFSSFLPGATPIRRNEQTLHEWIALAWYWMNGRI
jgi:uncharacterized SAM-binding protein YcdF (DUF218 family)